MLPDKKKSANHHNSLIYSLPLALVSAVSGIIGFNISFIQNKELVSFYIYSASFSFFFQIVTYSILNYKKNALLTRFKYTVNIRTSLIHFIVLNIILIYTIGLAGWFLWAGKVNALALFILMQLLFSSLQMMTFHHSNYFQIKKIDEYLKIQLFSTVIRAIAILLFIYFLKYSFFGLILSNMIGALILCLSYNIGYRQIVELYISGRTKIKYARNIFKVEGILRSYRGSSEAWMVTTVISILNLTRILKQSELDLINFSVPYVNSITSNFRQLFLKFERDSYLNNLKKGKLLFTFITLIPLALLFYFKDYAKLFIENNHIPGIRNIFNNDFLGLLALQLLILPFTLGYVYVDFSRKRVYYEFLIHKIRSLVLILLLILGFYYYSGSKLIFILFPLLPTISIALNKKYLVEKYI